MTIHPSVKHILGSQHGNAIQRLALPLQLLLVWLCDLIFPNAAVPRRL